MENIYVRHLELLGYEKRFFPSQHYVYMLMVKWSDLSEKLIYRTYPEIHTFHKSLKDMFPIESGQIEARDRIIPSLPAPRWLWESEKSRETTKSTLAEYCQKVISLPPHISRCKHLSSFFKVRPEDENPPAPNTLKRAETFLVSRDQARDVASEISAPIILDTYRVIADFEKSTKYEITLHTGDLVEIVEKNENGDKTTEFICYSEFYSLRLFPENFICQTHHLSFVSLRSTIRNAKSIHNKSRQRLSQETYRRNSRRYFQQKGSRLSEPQRNSRNAAKSPLKEMKNQDNIPEMSGTSSESELKKEAPVIPPRPSPELILERCTDNTRKKVSIHKSRSSS
ncbi:neutrophil cytosol factor 1 [Neolamprologus brichardi]|uniref:neutrophil cytosol factor 1 n=1 Tax=Neolamprologus brichardi TaxID=32507 RepID=UPI001643A86D|nr:neutrophil cytosol factor 1 [Neolamprologus brichardi]